MSYILDALKKSDQQRHRGAAPTLNTLPSSVEPARGPQTWRYPALAVVIAAAAFSMGLLRPWRTEPAVVAVVTSAPAIAAQVAAQAPEPPPSIQAPVTSQDPSPTGKIAGKERAMTASVDARSPMPARPHAQDVSRASSDRSAQAAATTASIPVSKEEKITEEKVLTLADLPAAIRAELPPMNVTVHAYTRAAKDRLVGVNDKLLREGDTLTPDLVLERITPDGMIFAYKGTRFQRGVR